LARSSNRGFTDSADQIDLESDELRGKIGKPSIVALRVSVIDRNILALDPAVSAEPFPPCTVEIGRFRDRHYTDTGESPNLLRVGGQAGKQNDERSAKK
jgi:hypothetical protein